MNQPNINSIINDSTLSDDAKNIVSLLFPVLVHMEQLSNELINIVDIGNDTQKIKNILMNDVIEGKSDKGIVGNINRIHNAVNISDKSKDKRIHTIEELIISISESYSISQIELMKKISECKNEIIKVLCEKVPWYKRITHLTAIFVMLSTITLLILNIMKIFGWL